MRAEDVNADHTIGDPIVDGFGALTAWPYSRGWGYYPSGGLGLVVVILLVLLLLGRI